MQYAIVVAGTHSNVGKTTISTALMSALRRRGLIVQGFKIGPDFIDPGFHSAATARPSRNIDGWMLTPDINRAIFTEAVATADVAIVEGVMGLFDGASAIDESGSTAEMAKWLGLPVVLVIDAAAQARSAAALVHGFESFDPDLRVVAVIANRVAGVGHYHYIENAIRTSCQAKPIGWLANNQTISLPSRHLGLVTAREVIDSSRLNDLADWIEASVDLDQLLTLSTVSIPIDVKEGEDKLIATPSTAPVRIGVALDQAFCFYYQENLELLVRLGAELVFWSPLEDALPSGLAGLYFGGGYPEIYAQQLSANIKARQAIKEFITAGGAGYAECGGLMYLTESIICTNGEEYQMVGVLPTRARMQSRLAALGYFNVEGLNQHMPLAVRETARGHQFRYSQIDPMPESITRSYRLSPRRDGEQSCLEGYVINNCLASYIHLHFLSNPNFATRWLALCRRTNVKS
ncbi:MAG: cobyrinate a,c-diamide synthase [Acidobacteriota bacterium]